jgi:hypothetical protein
MTTSQLSASSRRRWTGKAQGLTSKAPFIRWWRPYGRRQLRGVLGWLPLLLLSACVASHLDRADVRSSGLAPGPERPAPDLLLTRGNIQVAEVRLKDFGFDPGPADGTFTAETEAAVRAFQARYGLPVSGLLDRPTREELRLGVDPKRGD